ncbi:hypothetical protein LUX12_12090 [Streptomyces somaliensis]|uniref:hypothetical protein n=1 Tax=Streptomyces somaliensis TaxID=78355 RepID=UPI0020CC2C05|nr:hypothetical protein [Streptomyces somaliensis]MCP9945361.1 hypothetical protein [Streptomyces somaliensis]MCP9961435.1 hypothetical protein [Streptomyces somaliensis]MCP9974244.1 hypothetical protein [Streptomyces somaliensis]
MTVVRTQPRPANTAPAERTAAGTADEAGPRVRGGMTVEVALSVMAGARTGRLLLCDEDGRCTGLVTRARLTAVRESPSYTDRIRLRDVLGGHRPPAPSAAPGPGHAVHRDRPGAPPADGGGTSRPSR